MRNTRRKEISSPGKVAPLVNRFKTPTIVIVPWFIWYDESLNIQFKILKEKHGPEISYNNSYTSIRKHKNKTDSFQIQIVRKKSNQCKENLWAYNSISEYSVVVNGISLQVKQFGKKISLPFYPSLCIWRQQALQSSCLLPTWPHQNSQNQAPSMAHTVPPCQPSQKLLHPPLKDLYTEDPNKWTTHLNLIFMTTIFNIYNISMYVCMYKIINLRGASLI